MSRERQRLFGCFCLIHDDVNQRIQSGRSHNHASVFVSSDRISGSSRSSQKNNRTLWKLLLSVKVVKAAADHRQQSVVSSCRRLREKQLRKKESS
ncbi:uncharacterized protein V6R79_013174 [Siganus canaliculatus]